MSLEDLAEKMVDLQIESPLKVLAILAFITVFLLPGMLQLEVKPSTEAILPEQDPTVESLDGLRGKFYGDTTYVVFHAENIQNSELIKSMDKIQNRIETHENVYSTYSPADTLKQKHGQIPENQEKLEQIDYGPTVGDAYKTAVIEIRADTQSDSDEIRKLHDQVQTDILSVAPDAETSLTGYNMINLSTFNVIINDFMRITGVSFAAMLLVLFAVFRDPKKMLLPMVPVMFALIWMLGLGGWLGADLTIISMVSAAMIMGIGIDFGIHITKKYYSTSKDKQALEETMKKLSRGLLGGSLTTGVGFLSLLFANLAGMHSLGIFLFTGIMSAYLGAVVLMPTIIVLIGDVK